MSSDFKAVLPGLGLLTVLVLVFAVVIDQLEHVPVTRYRGYRGEARYNSYYAMSLMLEKTGLDVERIARLPARGGLPPAGATLFLTASRATYSERRYEKLLEWVEAGGHLVVAAVPDQFNLNMFDADDGEEEDRRDPLLKRLALRVDAEPEPTLDITEIPFRLPDTEETVVADLPRRLRAGEGVTWSVGPPDGARILHLARGAGGVTVLSGAIWMENVFVGDHQHATLAHYLATYGDRDTVWVVYGASVPDIVELTFEHGWPTLLAGAVALLLWLLASAQKFGHRHPVEETVRRSVVEHIEATAEFLWREGAASVLLDSVRAAVLGRAARSAPNWQTLSPEQRRAHVQEVAKIEPKELESLFGSQPSGEAAEFTVRIRLLRGIHTRL